MKSTSIQILLPLLVVPLALAACNKPGDEASKDVELPVRSVRTGVVQTGDLVDQVEVIGELQGVEEVRVYSQVPDRIRTLAVREGDEVKAGQLLAVIRGDLQSEAVNQAQAGLDAAVANSQALEDQVKRTKALVEAGTAARSQLDTLSAQLRAAQAQVRQLGASVSSASAQKSRTLVKSPISGVVSQVNLHEGDLASPQMPILTVVRGDAVKAVLRVPERDFLGVREGMTVRLSPLAEPDTTVTGEVTLKGPVVDRMTRTGLVEVRVPNEDGKLVVGSAVRALIELDRKKDVVLVPASALIMLPETDKDGKALAFVADGKKAYRRDVVVGARQGDRIEIRSGLKPGDRLVTLGAQLLRDGNPIHDVSEDTATAEATTTEAAG